jgi:hypothetical protein
MIPRQPVPVTCPQCQQNFTAQIQSIVDASEQPELKEELLRGRLNVVQCPNCGAAGAIATPLLYHDPDQELAFVLLPSQLGMAHDDQEKLVGTLTNTLIDSLPPDKRRGYLLQPRTFLTLESLIKAILEAEGVTPEMLDAQQKKLDLIHDLRRRLDDEEAFEAYVDEHRAEFDYELFLMIRAVIDSAREDGLEDEAEQLVQLRDRLLDITGGPAAERIVVEDFDELLELLRNVESDDERQAIVAVNRPVFDYTFFQELTRRMDAAQASGDGQRATELRQLREDLLSATESVDQQTEAALQVAADKLRTILSTEDPKQAVRDELDELDETFLIVLSANIAQAEEQGHADVAATLRELHEYVLDEMEEQMPPAARLVNRLLRADSAAERAEILDEANDLVDDELVSVLEAIVSSTHAQNQSALAAEFETIVEQVRSHVANSDNGT